MYDINIQTLAPFIEKQISLLDDPRYNDDYFCNAVAQEAWNSGADWYYDIDSRYIVTFDDIKAEYQDEKDAGNPYIGQFPNFRAWFTESLTNEYYREIVDFDDDFQHAVEQAVHRWLEENDLLNN